MVMKMNEKYEIDLWDAKDVGMHAVSRATNNMVISMHGFKRCIRISEHESYLEIWDTVSYRNTRGIVHPDMDHSHQVSGPLWKLLSVWKVSLGKAVTLEDYLRANGLL